MFGLSPAAGPEVHTKRACSTRVPPSADGGSEQEMAPETHLRRTSSTPLKPATEAGVSTSTQVRCVVETDAVGSDEDPASAGFGSPATLHDRVPIGKSATTSMRAHGGPRAPPLFVESTLRAGSVWRRPTPSRWPWPRKDDCCFGDFMQGSRDKVRAEVVTAVARPWEQPSGPRSDLPRWDHRTMSAHWPAPSSAG